MLFEGLGDADRGHRVTISGFGRLVLVIKMAIDLARKAAAHRP